MRTGERLNELEKAVNILWEVVGPTQEPEPAKIPKLWIPPEQFKTKECTKCHNKHSAVECPFCEAIRAGITADAFHKEIKDSPARIEALRDQLAKVRDELTRKEGKYRNEQAQAEMLKRELKLEQDRNQQLALEITELRGEVKPEHTIVGICQGCKKEIKLGEAFCEFCMLTRD